MATRIIIKLARVLMLLKARIVLLLKAILSHSAELGFLKMSPRWRVCPYGASGVLAVMDRSKSHRL
jgi:hypothetical protein